MFNSDQKGKTIHNNHIPDDEALPAQSKLPKRAPFWPQHIAPLQNIHLRQLHQCHLAVGLRSQLKWMGNDRNAITQHSQSNHCHLHRSIRPILLLHCWAQTSSTTQNSECKIIAEQHDIERRKFVAVKEGDQLREAIKRRGVYRHPSHWRFERTEDFGHGRTVRFRQVHQCIGQLMIYYVWSKLSRVTYHSKR